MESAAHALHAGERVASLGKSPQMGKERFQSKLCILSQVQPALLPLRHRLACGQICPLRSRIIRMNLPLCAFNRLGCLIPPQAQPQGGIRALQPAYLRMQGKHPLEPLRI